MALRNKMTSKEKVSGEPNEELLSQRGKVETGQFRLQVDRQTKASFVTYEAAGQAGMLIKKAHPAVRVSVFDTVECSNLVVELPAT
jgi:hypothetical protein